jgi:hypothetical protein
MTNNKKKKFIKKVEDFTCKICGSHVTGDGYTNHCPNCLWSKHVDINPGDRSSECGGKMKPIRTEYINNEFIIIHKCLKCGMKKRIRATENDNRDLLLKLLPKLK